MNFAPTPLAGSYEITLKPREDNRGWFARFFCKDEFQQIGHTKECVQMNQSHTNKKGAVRGMHYQHPPHGEIKLVRCISGAVLDVIVDLREGSQTFLQWFATELAASKKNMLYIPAGFAHGFQTLTEDCELIYLHSEYYVPGSEGGIKYNDPTININWPLSVTELSERDSNLQNINNNFKGI